MKESLGEMVVENFAANTMIVPNRQFYDTIQIDQQDIERDTYGLYNPRFDALGGAAAEHPDELLANLLVNGFNAPGYCVNAAGAPTNFFSANQQAQPGKNITPFTNFGTAKLSFTDYNIARVNMLSRLNAKGRPLNLGKKLLLVVSPKNETLAKNILQGDYIMQTAAGAVMGTGATQSQALAAAQLSNPNKGTADYLCWPRLAANPDMWFLIETGLSIKPLIVQIEKEPVLLADVNPTSYKMFYEHKMAFQAYGRYNTAYGLPELIYGSNGTTAATGA
jgi:phage major head subunit gpT-like protein